jgi:hypothetical protein
MELDLLFDEQRAAVAVPHDAAFDLCCEWLRDHPPTFDPCELAWDIRRQFGEEGFDLYLNFATDHDDDATFEEVRAAWSTGDRPPQPDDRLLIDTMAAARWDGYAPPVDVAAHIDRLALIERQQAAIDARRDLIDRRSRFAFSKAHLFTPEFLAVIDARFATELAMTKSEIEVPPTDFIPPSNHPPQSTPDAPRPLVQSAAALHAKVFEPIRWVVPGLIVEGLTICAGYPKIGKSWLALDFLSAVATAGTVLGSQIEEPGDTLYLALEDNERRLRNRIDKVLGPFVKWPERFHYATAWPRAEEGGLDQIKQWIESAASPKLIVVDVLAKFRTPAGRSTSAYDADYKAIQDLQSIASEKRVAIVVVHHLRKSAGEGDPFDKVSGTLGLSGGADTVMIVDRDANAGTVLYARGRDIEEVEHAIEFNKAACRWQMLGAAADVRRSDSRNAILTALQEHGPMTPAELVAATELRSENIRKLLWKMVRANEVMKTVGGAYIQMPVPIPSNPGNGVNAVTPFIPPR